MEDKISYDMRKYENLEDILTMCQEILLNHNLNYINVVLKYPENVDDVTLYIKNGFLPESYIDSSLISQIIEKYYVYHLSEEENEFLTGRRNERRFYLRGEEWIYANVQGWKDLAIKSGNSLPLLLYDKDQLYKSNRPITEMLIFKQLNALKYRSIYVRSQYEFKADINYDLISCLPVTRYAAGMSKGLYYKGGNDDKKFCGTFYYFEPESTTYLCYNTKRVYRNKYDALRGLREESGIKDEVVFKRGYSLYYDNIDNYPDDLMMSFNTYYNIRHNIDPNYSEEQFEEDLEYINSTPFANNKYYMGVIMGLYALEDEFDQEICLLAKRLDIDVIVLTHMIGSHQVVSEVLDTRDRMETFNKLSYKSK